MSAARRAGAVLLAAAALLAAGCGGDDEPDTDAVVAQLVTLCGEARADVEALGLPSEVGFKVIRPWANRGTQLAEDIGRLEGATTEQQAQLAALSRAYDEYYAGLRLGATIYGQTGSLEAYKQTVVRANAFLADADRIATELGATECTVRPFPDR